MNMDLGAIFEQFIASYVRLPLAHKIALPVLFVGSMIVIVFVSRWAARPDYATLFSGMAEGDAASVVEKLKDDKIGFRLRDNGSTIEITPPSMVHELRLEFAAAGLPSGGSLGFELFNENVLGRTGFVEQLTYIRALQGELERTISSIDAVKSVRVHVTNPKKSVFVKRDVLPTASVLLRLRPGAELDKKQVKGIANLVANSVQRLTPENVTILDSRGSMLNEPPSDVDSLGGDATQLAYKQKIEQTYSRRIESMLNQILGPGKAIARVTADIDFSKYEKEEEAYDPGGRVMRSSRSIEESNGLTAEGGVPGVVSNLTNDPGLLTPPNDRAGVKLRAEKVENFEISRAVSKTISHPGAIRKVTVAVLVDGHYTESSEPLAEGESPKKIYQALSTEKIRKIENLVKQTVGYDPARGDLVSVENIQFFEPDEDLEHMLQKAENQELIFQGLSWGLPALFTLLFFFLVLRPLVRFLVSPTEAEVDLSRLLPSGIEDLEAELEAERSRVSLVPEVSQTPSVDIQELEELLADNTRIVKDNPQQAALLIRYWLNEGRI